MRMIGIVAVMTLLAGPAMAQAEHVPRYGEQPKDKTNTEKAAEKNAEDAYRRSLGNIPEQKSSSDPWGTVRSDNAPPTAAAKKAPAKPKAAKTDATAKQ